MHSQTSLFVVSEISISTPGPKLNSTENLPIERISVFRITPVTRITNWEFLNIDIDEKRENRPEKSYDKPPTIPRNVALHSKTNPIFGLHEFVSRKSLKSSGTNRRHRANNRWRGSKTRALGVRESIYRLRCRRNGKTDFGFCDHTLLWFRDTGRDVFWDLAP